MGGNALKQYETHRLEAEDYFKLTKEFSDKFAATFGSAPALIKAYNNKPSFGDADFLVDSSYLHLFVDWTKELKSAFRLDECQYVKNGNVISIGYKHFQFDLIVTPHDDMEASYFYFSYNDFGNLIGRIGHKLGLKIAHDGLKLVVRHKARSDHILKEIVVTKDSRQALDVLGLDRQRYEQGFDSLEDIFDYVASSKYFDPEIYSLEHRSATSRIRDKKRATYNAFLRWVADTKPKANHEFGEKSELGGYSLRMPYYETEICSRWSWVKPEVDQLIADFEFDLKFKEIYNGQIVSELTGYSGKTLGAFMQHMKPKINKTLWMSNPKLMEYAVNQLWMDLGGVQFKVD